MAIVMKQRGEPMRLIDAEPLIKFCTYCADDVIVKIDRNTMAKMLADAPEIDAAPVVRCKNCKQYEIAQLKRDGTDDRRYKPSYCMLLRHYFEEDWFCADGERRER